MNIIYMYISFPVALSECDFVFSGFPGVFPSQRAPNVLDQQDPSQLQPQRSRFTWQKTTWSHKPGRVVKRQHEQDIKNDALELISQILKIFVNTTCLEKIWISNLLSWCSSSQFTSENYPCLHTSLLWNPIEVWKFHFYIQEDLFCAMRSWLLPPIWVNQVGTCSCNQVGL